MRWLRYYAATYDENEHRKILALLEEIKRRHGIDYEEIPIKRREWYNKKPIMAETDVYERHLKPQTRVIKENTGFTVAELFKSRSGYIYVAGTIAVVEDNYVIWATPFKQIEFLERVLNNPEQIYEFKSGRGKEIKNIHDELFKRIVKRNLPEPEVDRRDKIWIREVATGFKRVGIEIKKRDIANEVERLYESFREKYRINRSLNELEAEGLRRITKSMKSMKQSYENYKICKDRIGTFLIDETLYKKGLQKVLSDVYGFGCPLLIVFADFVVLSKRSNWVIEGKKELNYEAIGQVLVYKDLLEEDYPELGELKMGIACLRSDPRLKETCKKLGINVFVV